MVLNKIHKHCSTRQLDPEAPTQMSSQLNRICQDVARASNQQHVEESAHVQAAIINSGPAGPMLTRSWTSHSMSQPYLLEVGGEVDGQKTYTYCTYCRLQSDLDDMVFDQHASNYKNFCHSMAVGYCLAKGCLAVGTGLDLRTNHLAMDGFLIDGSLMH